MNAHITRPAQAYWDMTAEKYDQIFPNTVVGQAQREVVWHELSRIFHAGQRVLELNCGTGIDAVRLAGCGVRVLACDISPRMIEVACRRAMANKVSELITFRALPTENIAALSDESPFDGAFSNFCGLNCVEDLTAVARNMAGLLKRRAQVVVCMMGRFFLWETVLYLMHGNPGKATRRFKSGSVGRLNDDATVAVFHRSVGTITRMFAPEFRLRRWRGVGITIPPAHLENWAQRHPNVLNALTKMDQRLGRMPVFRSLADCVLLQFEYAPKRA